MAFWTISVLIGLAVLSTLAALALLTGGGDRSESENEFDNAMQRWEAMRHRADTEADQ